MYESRTRTIAQVSIVIYLTLTSHCNALKCKCKLDITEKGRIKPGWEAFFKEKQEKFHTDMACSDDQICEIRDADVLPGKRAACGIIDQETVAGYYCEVPMTEILGSDDVAIIEGSRVLYCYTDLCNKGLRQGQIGPFHNPLLLLFLSFSAYYVVLINL